MRRSDAANAIQGEERLAFKPANENLIGADDERLSALRRRIGWICHILRFGAPITFIWGVSEDVINAADTAALSKSVAYLFGENVVQPIADWQRLALFACSLPSTMAHLALAYNAWLLFSGYLAGRIFTVDAARLIQRCGVSGIASVILNLLMRPLVVPILAATRPAGAQLAVSSMPYLGSGDLHSFIFYLALIGLAHIQKVAAELYSENGQIV